MPKSSTGNQDLPASFATFAAYVDFATGLLAMLAQAGHTKWGMAAAIGYSRESGIPYDQVRMGLRVEAVWSEGGRYPDHYRPTGEPDADYDVYKELL